MNSCKLVLIISFLLCFFITAKAQPLNFKWVKSMGGAYNDQGLGVASHGNGNVFVIGHYFTTASTVANFNPGGSGGLLTSAGAQDLFLVKFDTNGTFQWVKGIGGTSGDWGSGVTTDAAGNVYITGHFRGGTAGIDFNPGGSGGVLTSNSYNAFLAKYDTNGNFIWAKSLGGINVDAAKSVATDAFNNVYITGDFNSPTADFNPGGSGGVISAIGVGYQNVFVAKYNASGTFLWAKSIGGTANTKGQGVAVDIFGNVVLTGLFTGADFNPGGSGGVLNTSGVEDVFVAKYDASGTFIWAKSGGGSAYDQGNGISTDASGNVYVTGQIGWSSTIDFNPGGVGGAVTSSGNADAFLVKYNANGIFQWVKGLGGIGSDEGFGVASDDTGNVYITGNFPSTIDFNPGGSGGTITTSGNHDIYVASYNTNGGFLWAKNMGGIGNDYGKGIAADPTGNVYVTGLFNSATTDFNPGGNGGTPSFAGGTDIFLVRLNKPSCNSHFRFIISACNSYNLNGQNYLASGRYTQTLANAAGCDSIITLQLTIDSAQAIVVQSGNMLMADSADAYQWLDCNNAFSPIPGATNQSFTPIDIGSYAVEVTQQSCRDTSTCFMVVSMDELSLDNDVLVYPNPTNGQITLKSKEPFNNATVRLINISGQTLMEITNEHGTEVVIDMNLYFAGIYFVEIENEGKIVRHKIVKN